jgi:hypothetical protein
MIVAGIAAQTEAIGSKIACWPDDNDDEWHNISRTGAYRKKKIPKAGTLPSKTLGTIPRKRMRRPPRPPCTGFDWARTFAESTAYKTESAANPAAAPPAASARAVCSRRLIDAEEEQNHVFDCAVKNYVLF